MTLPRILGGAAAIALSIGILTQMPASAESIVRAPAPAVNPASPAKTETALFAGGCFWGVQGVYQHVKGVTSAVSGYTGGTASAANYDSVSTGGTGHTEAVKVTFDPAQVSYGQLLQIYFSVVADPTQLNAQGPDRGPQYRSALFPTNARQLQTAKAYLGQLSQAKLWKRPIVTKVERAQGFFPAERYHQDYLTRHPNAPYIRINDMPKVAGLKSLYPGLYREKPVLVRAS
ncbi:peptide-methionine (S)-S-oxide reductase MsrA [Sphingomonas sp. ID0503]|uniref:peptide-methionine (S)-S-oxide reductase MsrA n=1 Tax=Sphingomonas sp. ID0503 TaxID=3399691 RepID=UPI003AFA548F